MCCYPCNNHTKSDMNKVDLNLATLDELKCLPGIGEKISRKLIAERQEKSFDSYMDVINRVDGITHFKINTWINHKMVDLSLNEKLFFKKCMQHLCQTKVIISLIALLLFLCFWIYIFVQCQTNLHGKYKTHLHFDCILDHECNKNDGSMHVCAPANPVFKNKQS